MSTSPTITPNATHPTNTSAPALHNDRRARAEQRRTRALELHLSGNSYSAIAAELDVSERSVRNYLYKVRQEFAEDHRAERKYMHVRAIESQRAIAAMAVAAFHEERDRERAILAGQHDYITRRAVKRLDGPSPSARRLPGDAPYDAHAVPDDDDDLPGAELLFEEIERPASPTRAPASSPSPSTPSATSPASRASTTPDPSRPPAPPASSSPTATSAYLVRPIPPRPPHPISIRCPTSPPARARPPPMRKETATTTLPLPRPKTPPSLPSPWKETATTRSRPPATPMPPPAPR